MKTSIFLALCFHSIAARPDVYFPDDSILENAATGVEAQSNDLFDEANFSEDEKKCLSQRQFWYKDKCYTLKSIGPCAKNELLFLTKPGEREDVGPLKAICKVKPSCNGSNEVFWPSLNRCELKTVIKNDYCKGENRVITKNDFGDSICGCSLNHGEMADKEGCFEYYQRGPCEANEVVTYDEALGSGVCSPDRCYELNRRSKSRRSITDDHHVGHYGKTAVESKTRDKRQAAGKRKQYAPLNGDGQCYKLNTIGPCAIVGDQAKFVIDDFSFIPRCKKAPVLYVIDPPLLCRVDNNNRCRDPVNIQHEDRQTYLANLRNQLKDKIQKG